MERFVIHPPGAPFRPFAELLLILWHGAGGDIDERTLVSVASAFADRGATAARARFDYRLAGRRAPDRMPALLESARSTVEAVRAATNSTATKLVLGGRSMGGRVASMLAADGLSTSGLIFLSYPLHPEKKTSNLRDAHLPAISCPMLFVQGDRDALCRLELLRPVLDRLEGRGTLALFPGADHSFRKVDPALVAKAACDWWIARAGTTP